MKEIVKIQVEAPLKWIDAHCKGAKYTGELVLTDKEFEEFKANPYKFFKVNQIVDRLNLEFDETVINKQGPISKIWYKITGTSIKSKQKKTQKEFAKFEDTKGPNYGQVQRITSDEFQEILDYIKKEETEFELLPDEKKLERGFRSYLHYDF